MYKNKFKLLLHFHTAARIVPSFTEVRMYERLEAGGRSPKTELLWCWAQQNPRVQDLLEVLQDMGHYRAMQLFQDQCYAVKGTVNATSKLPAPGLYISQVISTDGMYIQCILTLCRHKSSLFTQCLYLIFQRHRCPSVINANSQDQLIRG